MNCALLLMISCLVAGDQNAWPAFLGQGASAINPETIPLNWSPTENIAWTANLPGKGQSSPVIWGNQVFVTSIEGSMKDKCHLVALSLSDGHELWRQTFASGQTVRSNYFQSRSAPTPVVDTERVYAFYETGNLVACTHAGESVWQRCLTDEYGPIESNIGLAASPILVDGVLVVLVDHEGPSYLLGIDPATGENRWKTERTSRTSYSSPSGVQIEGKNQIVCSSAGSIDGYSPQTGELLWTYEENIGGNRSGAALPIADGMFAVGASPGMHNEKEEEAKNTNFIMQVKQIDGQFVPKVVWRTNEAMPSFNSPMAHAGHAYWVNKVGVVYCFDLATGEKKYTHRTNGICWATPVGIGDRVYLFGKDGMTTVLATGPEYKVLAENQLWDPEKVGNDTINRERSRRSRSGGDHENHGSADPSKPGQDPAAPESGARTDKPADAEPATSTAQKSVDTPAPADGSSPGENKPSDGAQEATNGRGRPAMTDKEREAARAAGENRFADPVQYGVAIVNGSIVIRSGEIVYCVRSSGRSTAAK